MAYEAGGGGRRRTGLNVLGGPLGSCNDDPVTGFYRDGCCNTGPEDVGSHGLGEGQELSRHYDAYGM